MHHLIPDNVARSNPFMQEAMKRGLFGLDEKPNIIEIASSNEALKKADQMFKDGIIATKFPPVIHRGSHDKNDRMTEEIIEEKLKDLKSPIDITDKKQLRIWIVKI